MLLSPAGQLYQREGRCTCSVGGAGGHCWAWGSERRGAWPRSAERRGNHSRCRFTRAPPLPLPWPRSAGADDQLVLVFPPSCEKEGQGKLPESRAVTCDTTHGCVIGAFESSLSRRKHVSADGRPVVTELPPGMFTSVDASAH